MRISGSSVLLTGASGGIGHAIAKAVADHGGRLIVTGRRVDVLDELTAKYGGRAIVVDLADRDDVERNRGEVDVAPVPQRILAGIAGVAPAFFAGLIRRAGADVVSAKVAEGQRDKR